MNDKHTENNNQVVISKNALAILRDWVDVDLMAMDYKPDDTVLSALEEADKALENDD